MRNKKISFWRTLQILQPFESIHGSLKFSRAKFDGGEQFLKELIFKLKILLEINSKSWTEDGQPKTRGEYLLLAA